MIWERFFFYLNRVNAVVFAIILVVVAVTVISEFSRKWSSSGLGSSSPEFGHDVDQPEQDYTGEGFATATGEVLIYNYASERNLSVVHLDEASDFTLVHPDSGKQRKIAGDDSGKKVISFEAIEGAAASSDSPISVAYIARLADEDMYSRGVSDIVLGNLPALDQIVIARNAPHLDYAALSDNGRQIAILFWPSNDTAQLVSVDAQSLEIVRSDPVSLPARDTMELTSTAQGEELRTEAAHRNLFAH